MLLPVFPYVVLAIYHQIIHSYSQKSGYGQKSSLNHDLITIVSDPMQL